MSELLMHHYQDKHSSFEDASLTEQLLDVFKRKFHGSKQLQVLGILSYSSDNDPEKFVKIDFSSGVSSSCSGGECSTHEQHFECHANTTTCHVLKPKDMSSPVSPPTVVHNNLTSNNYDYSSSPDRCLKVCDDFCDTYGDSNRRDRRKCRRPKRQLIESESLGSAETSTSQGAVNKMGFCNDPLGYGTAAKSLRLDSPSTCIPCSVTESVPDGAGSDDKSSLGIPNPLQLHSEINRIPTALDPCSMDSTAHLSIRAVSKLSSGDSVMNDAVYSSGGTENIKFKIAPKSLGINDLGELCGILPISALLSRASNSNNEVGSTSVTGHATNSLVCTNMVMRDSTMHSSANQLGSAIPSTTCNSQSILVNPTLAAALAAAFSGSPVATNVTNEGTPGTSTVGFSSPTITFTGASGEVVGSIPVSSVNSSYAVVSSALPTVSSVLSTTGSSPANNYTAAANLASVISSLRSTNVSSEGPMQAALSIPASTNSCPSVISNSQIALLQSISTNNQKPLISVGPTLALIGTLGLNPSPVSSTAPSESSIANISVSTMGSTLLTTQLGQSSATNVTNNNAALVAAALLRGLVSAKQPAQETVEHLQVDTANASLTSPLTIITNGVSNASQIRPTFIADNSVSSLNAILAPRATNLNSLTAASIASISDVSIIPSLSSSISSLPTGCTLQNSTRNSIMLSYPRTSGEMNILLTPTSVASNTLTPTLSSLSSVPATFSLQNISNTGQSGITLTPPLVLHPHSNITSLPSNNSAISTTCTISVSTPGTSTKQQVCINGGKQADVAACHPAIKPNMNEVKSGNRTIDPTTSAIDRILQTIKGCMNSAENRENDTKSRVSKRVENNSATLIGGSDRIHLDTISSSSNKFQPMTICLSKSSAGVMNSDSCNTNSRISLSGTERLPLPPLNKGSSDTESQTASITKVYRCRYCGKTFNRKFCRERHERLHTGVKPYTCEICDEKFIRLEDKKRHVRSLQHILVGRGSLLKDESPSLSSGDVNIANAEPSCVLPLLAHTLPTDESEATEEALTELDDPIDPGTSELSSGEHESECDSFEAEDDLEKEITGINTKEINCLDSLENETSPVPNSVQLPLVIEESYISPNVQASDKTVSSSESQIDDMSQQSMSEHRLRIRCRHALKETQAESNNASGHHFDALSRTVPLDTKLDSVS